MRSFPVRSHALDWGAMSAAPAAGEGGRAAPAAGEGGRACGEPAARSRGDDPGATTAESLNDNRSGDFQRSLRAANQKSPHGYDRIRRFLTSEGSVLFSIG